MNEDIGEDADPKTDTETDTEADTDTDTGPMRRTLSPGWLTSSCAIGMFLATVLTIILTTNQLTFYVTQAAAFGLLLALIGLSIGSETLIAIAVAPMLGSVLIGVQADSEADWGRALIVGCLLYISAELAWSALRQRAGVGWTTAIAIQRAREVATVVATSLAVGLAAIGLTTLAPTRTIVVRVLIAAALLLSLLVAVRHLSATAPSSDEQTA